MIVQNCRWGVQRDLTLLREEIKKLDVSNEIHVVKGKLYKGLNERYRQYCLLAAYFKIVYKFYHPFSAHNFVHFFVKRFFYVGYILLKYN